MANSSELDPLSTVYPRGTSEFDRGLSFFDAVFGFALTLLIANLDMPDPAAWKTVRSVLSDGVGSQLLGFLLSFFVIVMIWRGNFSIVKRFRAFDGRAITQSIILIGLVIFIPFTTQGISDPDYGYLELPTALYAINVAAAIIVQVLLYQGAINRGLVRTDLPPDLRRAEIIDSLVNPAVLLASVPIALAFGGEAGKLTWLLMLVLSPLSGYRLQQRTKQVMKEAANKKKDDKAEGAT